MLGVKAYTKQYITDTRARIAADIATYEKLVTAAQTQPATAKALEAFEATFFNNMVLALDHYFVHRLRTVEGKDGNPLNEVRILCDSLKDNNGAVQADKTIKYDAAKSVLKYKIGDSIKLNKADFVRLSDAFLAEIERKFMGEAIPA